MKELVYFKQYNNHEIAHLYEHAFALSLADYMNSKNLIEYVDYKFTAQTYDNGLIKVSLSLISKEANLIENDFIKTAEFRFLDTAIKSLENEEGYKLKLNKKETEKIFDDINKLSWLESKNLDIKKITDTKTKEKDSIVTTIKSDRNILSVKIQSKTNDKNFPLHYVLSSVIAFNIESRLGFIGAYFKDNKHRKTKQKLTNNFNYYCQNTTIMEVEAYVDKCLKYLEDNNLFNKVEKFMLDKDNQQLVEQINEDIFYLDGTLIGDKGWKKIINRENYIDYLKSTTIEIGLDNKWLKIDMNSLIK